MLGEAEVDIPSWNQDHVILQVLALDLGLLHDNNVCLQRVEHCLQSVSFFEPLPEQHHSSYLIGAVCAPWLIPEWISGAGQTSDLHTQAQLGGCKPDAIDYVYDVRPNQKLVELERR